MPPLAIAAGAAIGGGVLTLSGVALSIARSRHRLMRASRRPLIDGGLVIAAIGVIGMLWAFGALTMLALTSS